jgi:hypothetical protein
LRVFVSYRRDDVPDATDRLTEDLRERFGRENVFIDIDSIEIGADFADVIADWVARADVFLAVIGRNWVDAKRLDGDRRIDGPGDYIRIEIEAALQQNRRAVPVLIHGAAAPAPSQLPPSVAPLMRRNAVELSRRYWDEDVRVMIEALERIPPQERTAAPGGVGAGEQNLAGEPEATAVHRPGPGATPVAAPTGDQVGEAAPATTASASATTGISIYLRAGAVGLAQSGSAAVAKSEKRVNRAVGVSHAREWERRDCCGRLLWRLSRRARCRRGASALPRRQWPAQPDSEITHDVLYCRRIRSAVRAFVG